MEMELFHGLKCNVKIFRNMYKAQNPNIPAPICAAWCFEFMMYEPKSVACQKTTQMIPMKVPDLDQ